MYDLNKVFKLAEIDDEQVIIKVNAKDSLTVARYPFLSSDYDYITVTRGGNHILTVIKSDGKTFSFHWGTSGYTLISEDFELLRKQVCQFIHDNYIMLELKGKPESKKVNIYYNANYKKWQLSCNANFWSDKATDLESAIKDFSNIVTADEWKNEKAITGIDIWTAVNPVFKEIKVEN
jgi:hypothetical protein